MGGVFGRYGTSTHENAERNRKCYTIPHLVGAHEKGCDTADELLVRRRAEPDDSYIGNRTPFGCRCVTFFAVVVENRNVIEKVFGFFFLRIK